MKQTLLSFALMLLPMLASAAVEKNGIYYNLNNGTGTAEVTKHPNKYQGAISIPDKVVINGTEYNVTSIGIQAFMDNGGLTSVTIPSSVTSMGESAFSMCSGLTAITLPSKMKSIGVAAFVYCTGLTSITIPSSVTSIGADAFRHCSSLSSIKVEAGNTKYDSRDNCNAIIETASNTLIAGCKKTTIPNSVTSIGNDAFSGSGVTTITIPSSVTSLGVSAFQGCMSLTSIIVPNSVTSMGSSVFSGCNNLTSATISGSVTSIENDAFWDCRSLTSITIPDGVTSIGASAFDYCINLTSVTIPGSVTSIGNSAFWRCRSLLDVFCYAGTVPSTGDKTFKDANNENVTLHVPAGSVSAYQAAEPWNQFKAIVGISEDVNGVSLDKTEAILKKGKTLTLKATVTPETLADKSVTWKSSDTKIATVTSDGTVKGVKTGTVTITCTSVATGAKATCKVTVATITLDQTNVVVRKNKTVTLTPTVYPTTLTDKSVKWKSSDKTIATVASDGTVKGVKTGTATITCTSVATGLSATCKVTVGTITLDQTKVVIRKNKTVTLTPTVYPTTLADKSVKWESSDKKIATVSSSGVVKGVKTGTVTITCTSVATGLSTTCAVTVGTITLDQTKVVVRKNKTVTLTPTVYPTTLTNKSVKWQSSDKKIATVASNGTVTGVKTGIVTITCTSVATGLSATCEVTVGTITLDQTSVTVIKGNTVKLTPTVYPTTLADKSVTWLSSKDEIATVSDDGTVTAGKKAGTAIITCTSVATGLSTTCKVKVTASSGARTKDGDDADVTGIEMVESPAAEESFDVYDLGGRQVLQRVTSLDGLPAGVYIVNGKKMLKK